MAQLLNEYGHECPICGTVCWLPEQAEAHCTTKRTRHVDHIKKQNIHVSVEDTHDTFYRNKCKRPQINMTIDQYMAHKKRV